MNITIRITGFEVLSFDHSNNESGYASLSAPSLTFLVGLVHLLLLLQVIDVSLCDSTDPLVPMCVCAHDDNGYFKMSAYCSGRHTPNYCFYHLAASVSTRNPMSFSSSPMLTTNVKGAVVYK